MTTSPERLHAIAGRWASSGQVLGDEPAEISGTDVYDVFPGGHFLVHHVDVTIGSEHVRVIEIIPPAVNTDLGGPGLHTMGAPLEPFADEVTARLVAGEEEIAYGMAAPRAAAAHAAFDEGFKRMNA